MSGRSGYSNNAGKTTHKRKDEKDRKHAEARKYAQIPKESILLYSETVVEKIGDDIARPLAEDISYRLREVIHACSTYLSQANRSRLTTEDVNKVLHFKDIPPIFGHSGRGIVGFTYVEDSNIFFEDDPEVDIIQLALSTASISQKRNHFIKSMWLLPIRSSDLSDSGPCTTVCDTEGRIPLPATLVNYFKHAYRILYGSSKDLFKVLTSDFQTNPKLGPVVPHLVEAISKAIEEADRHGLRRFWLLDAIDALADNEAIDLSPSLSVNVLVTCLIHCALDFYSFHGAAFIFSAEEYFRQKSAFILSKVLRRWCGSVLVREVLRKLSAILQDFSTPLPVHLGALHVLTAMGQAPLSLCLWPLLISPGNYAAFLNVIQTVEELIIDFEAIKNVILVGAQTLHLKEIARNVVEEGDLPNSRRPSTAELEQEELAMGVQQVLYDVFGDAVCCRWPLPTSSYQPQFILPRQVLYKSPLYKSNKVLTKKKHINLDEVFEEKCVLLPSLVNSTDVLECPVFNLGGSILMLRRSKPCKQSIDHVAFTTHSPYQRACVAFLWTGKMNPIVHGIFHTCGNLKTIL